MKEFISDLFYMCSASNTTSRTFYIIVTTILGILTLAIPGTLVFLIVSIVKGMAVVLPIILLVVCIIIYVAVLIWLKKS